MKYTDEDYGYEMERQRRIDARDDEECRQLGIVRETRFGGAMKHSDKIQKYAHRDPRPDLPFEEDKEFVHAGIAAVCVGVVIALLAVLWGYS